MSTSKIFRVYGEKRAKKIQRRLAELRAAEKLSDFPPKQPPSRCHELKGNLKGTLSVDLDHPYRLIFRPNHDIVPSKEDGGLDWDCVTAICILEVQDTHE